VQVQVLSVNFNASLYMKDFQFERRTIIYLETWTYCSSVFVFLVFFRLYFYFLVTRDRLCIVFLAVLTGECY